MADWSKLPRDIIEMISKSFDTLFEIITLRSVCSSWRSSIPRFKKNPPLPMYLPIVSSSSPLKLDEQYILEENTIYIVQDLRSETSNCWVIRIGETRPGIFCPIHPLSRFSTEGMPVDFPKSLNLPDYRITDIGTAYSLDLVKTSDMLKEIGTIDLDVIKKIIVSPEPWFVDSGGYGAMLIYEGKLGFINLQEKTWKLYSELDDHWYFTDVAYHKGKFYAVDTKGRFVEIGSDLVAKEATDLFYANELHYEYFGLVKSCDDNLFLICEPATLSVLKWNEEENHWDAVDSLGEEIFFIGKDCSYAVRSGEFPGLKGNCIYFYDVSYDNNNEGLGEFCHDISVQLMEDDSGGPLSYMHFYEYSFIFWPPPTWLH